mmetsp:Transcript_10021/g.29737  ORF Transcript_10021/g.29737 Transcript_10021/m.29737 type:complete len:249 (-) Transcript_10021:218-964(-)
MQNHLVGIGVRNSFRHEAWRRDIPRAVQELVHLAAELQEVHVELRFRLEVWRAVEGQHPRCYAYVVGPENHLKHPEALLGSLRQVLAQFPQLVAYGLLHRVGVPRVERPVQHRLDFVPKDPKQAQGLRSDPKWCRPQVDYVHERDIAASVDQLRPTPDLRLGLGGGPAEPVHRVRDPSAPLLRDGHHRQVRRPVADLFPDLVLKSLQQSIDFLSTVRQEAGGHRLFEGVSPFHRRLGKDCERADIEII